VPARGTAVGLEERRLAYRWLARGVLLVVWSLVAWGTLLLLATLARVADEGLRPALAHLLPSRGASVWAWLNALSAALALAVGVVVGGLLVWARSSRTPKASSSGPDEAAGSTEASSWGRPGGS
jgi:hypothetical protein